MIETICPECYQGKHVNCAKAALDEELDEITHCECDLAGHERCGHCGELLHRRDCDDGLNHCTDCRPACRICGERP